MNIQEEAIQYEYDIALSFAGEDRKYVEEVALQLKGHGVKVFYDKFEEDKLWGKNLYDYLSDIYTKKAKYTIMFISKHYKVKLWTNHERESMQERAFQSSSEYILPVRFDDTEIPGVRSTTGYIDIKDKEPSFLAGLVLKKIQWKLKKRWWGKWEVESVSLAFNSLLEIFEVNNVGFIFTISNIHGAHSGEVSGMAKFTNENEASFTSEKIDDEVCKLKFTKVNDVIQVSENDGCRMFCGMRSYFMGDYILNKDIFYNIDIVDDSHLTVLYAILTEKHWIEFIKCFSDIHRPESLDGINARVIAGGMPGLYTIYEGIIMVDSNKIWGAYLDSDTVYYFTNTSEENLPRTFEKWRENFKNIPVTKIDSTI